MNRSTREMLAKKNKCSQGSVNCFNCFYKEYHSNFCNYHKQGIINFDEACYKFKKG